MTLWSQLQATPFWPLSADEVIGYPETLRDDLRAERDRRPTDVAEASAEQPPTENGDCEPEEDNEVRLAWTLGATASPDEQLRALLRVGEAWGYLTLCHVSDYLRVRVFRVEPDGPVKVFPDDAANQERIGQLLTALQERGIQLTDAAEADAVDYPNCAAFYYKRGHAWFEAAEYEKAFREFDRALSRDPLYAVLLTQKYARAQWESKPLAEAWKKLNAGHPISEPRETWACAIASSNEAGLDESQLRTPSALRILLTRRQEQYRGRLQALQRSITSTGLLPTGFRGFVPRPDGDDVRPMRIGPEPQRDTDDEVEPYPHAPKWSLPAMPDDSSPWWHNIVRAYEEDR
jgi:tetratricopeptide (TPR) repeat protein